MDCSGLKKETRQLNTMHDPGLDPRLGEIDRRYIVLKIYKI